MSTVWSVRSSSGRASRTAHVVAAGGQALCGWSHHGNWDQATPFARRCGRCEASLASREGSRQWRAIVAQEHY